MSDTGTPVSLPALVRPTVDTPFHVDFEWWKRRNLAFDVEVRAHLCPTHRDAYLHRPGTEEIDWVDEETGEVTRVDGLQHVLRVHCSKQPAYFSKGLPLVEAVLRVFLSNGNGPLTSRELGNITGRPPERILRTLAGHRVYKGLRPARSRQDVST